MLDLKIANGEVVDGTGRPRFKADIGVKDGRIVAIGAIDESAARTIDAEGKIVSPGFVDVHTHYDAQIFWDPTLSPSCYHGVTTVLTGFCGFSIAPMTPESAKYLLPMLARVEGMPIKVLELGVPWDWTSFGSYLDKFEGKAGLNIGTFAGHSAIRRAVMGPRAVGEKATEDELRRMVDLLDRSLAEGALGFSTDVSRAHTDGDGNPVPSRHATRAELLALASVCGRHEGTSIELLPKIEFEQDMVDLLADVSIAARRPVNWNAISIGGASEAELIAINRKLSASDHARKRGGDVAALVLPSTPALFVSLASGVMFDVFQEWEYLFRLPIPERMKKLRDPETRSALRQAAEADKGMHRVTNWSDYFVTEAFTPETKKYQGRTVGDIARAEAKEPWDVFIDISLADGLKTVFSPLLSGEDAATYGVRGKVWQDDRTIIGASDAGAHMDLIDTFAYSTRLLEAGVRKYRVIGLEQAVRQLTEVPAKYMGLRDRGVLAPGMKADIVIFDPDSVGCGPTYTREDLPGGCTRLYADAFGIDHVIVNGTPIVSAGRHTGALPGTVLRSGRDTYTVKLPAQSQ